MHPAYINNRGTFFSPLFTRAWFILTLGAPLWKFRETSPVQTWSRSSFFPLLSSKAHGQKSVNILPRIHVAYSVTLEKLTVYPLKNNVYSDISSKLWEFDEGMRERDRGRKRERKERERERTFFKTRVFKPTRFKRCDCFAKKIALFFTISRSTIEQEYLRSGEIAWFHSTIEN